MIDSAIPTIASLNARYGGCFCQHCMTGFRDCLRANLSDAELASWEIADLESFNYREYLLARGFTDERYRAEILAFPPIIPLAGEYFDFQWKEVNSLFRAFKRYAQEFGDDVPMSSNSPFYWAEFMYAVDAHDFYTNEMQYLPPEDEILPTDPVYTFKLADALDRLLAITGVPRAFEPCRLNDRPRHIRLWIAQAYAHGHVFMAPDKMWTLRFAGEPDRWYHSKPGDYEPIYHFIRDYPELFDGYESFATIALIFSNQSVRQYLGDRLSGGHLGGQNRSAPRTDLAEACFALSRANLPFRILVAGDDWLEDRLLEADLSPYRAVLRFEPSFLSVEQEAKLQSASERLITWSGAGNLLDRLVRDIQVSGSENISVQLRHKPGRADAPLIIHLLNSNYELETDQFRPVRDVQVEIAKEALARSYSRATMYALGTAPCPIDCRVNDERTVVTVPELDMWAIIKL
ncbi:MAG: hypothetical protein OXG23_08845, partial [Chloroflexi bacterium]|nr:hypothetical protein [Chloroflexota bacterium]